MEEDLLTKTRKAVSFKDILTAPYSNIGEKQQTQYEDQAVDMIMEERTSSIQNIDDEEGIYLTEAEQQRIYKPWIYSIIIKIIGRKLNHQYLKKKLSTMWRVSEEIVLIDLGYDYYIVKIFKEENLQKTLQQGPWFVNGFFLSIKRWHPNFFASEAKETKSAIWIRLPELPTEFYDHSILARIGKKLGKLVKMDVCTSEALRGRYARICVEVLIDVPVRKYICIGHYKQPLQYEGLNILCSKCGVLGHTNQICPKNIPNTRSPTNGEEDETARKKPQEQGRDLTTKEEAWQLVSFEKRASNTQK
ncbi:uncharacterized protein LOC125834407 [Solanum verrucosum]|uniref:uncharacterized protein LOC125834407 n=1 Tax=Solanum verrucosum TaxID=315347 RepID=UPI0020D01612|nr:uncharacterized protein LOC125834407 [Solanum verrucosum]